MKQVLWGTIAITAITGDVAIAQPYQSCNHPEYGRFIPGETYSLHHDTPTPMEFPPEPIPVVAREAFLIDDLYQVNEGDSLNALGLAFNEYCIPLVLVYSESIQEFDYIAPNLIRLP